MTLILLIAALFAGSGFSQDIPVKREITNTTAKDITATIIVTVPAFTPQSDTVYIMGSFNNWDPGKYEPPDSSDLPLELIDPDTWRLVIDLPAKGKHEYKYTRGSNETVEKNLDSTDVENRIIVFDEIADPIYYDTVQTWADFVLPPVPETGSPVLSFSNNSPQTSIAVTWATESFGDSRIYYGIENVNENVLAVNEHRDMISNGDSLIHTVTLNNLTPATKYMYRVITDGVYESGVLGFTTAGYTEKFTFIVIGDNRPSLDVGVQNGIMGDNPELILHTGDVVQNGTNLADWFVFFRNWEKPLGTLPWLVVYGNHEEDVRLNKFFDFPENGSEDPDNSGHWYSIDYNNVHIIALDNYRPYWEGSEQYDWLINDLENIPAGIDHTIIMFHAPPFSSGKHGSNLSIREHLVPVIEEYNIDMVFCGHEHLYERSDVNGIPYFTTGGAGSPLYSIRGGINEHSVYAESDFHYIRLHVDGKNMTAEVIRTDSTLIDYYKISKEPPPPVPEQYELSQNFPNPFNPTTTIRYGIPDEAYVTLEVFDVLGALVATLVDGQKSPGSYDVKFHVNTAGKNIISSGVYLYRLKAGDYSVTKKLIVLK